MEKIALGRLSKYEVLKTVDEWREHTKGTDDEGRLSKNKESS